MKSTVPTLFTRRSQLYRRHCIANASFEKVAGSAVVNRYVDTGDEVHRATHLAIADLSTLPRTGFKGAGAPGWLEAQGIQLPSRVNQSRLNEDGDLIARLSSTEFLILADLVMNPEAAWLRQERLGREAPDGVYFLPRADSHFWFAISGAYAPSTLAKLCGVDLRTHKFSEREVAQTSLARSNAIILRRDFTTTPGFYILGDVSLTEYLWDSLLDAMLEFDGQPVGIAALRALGNSEKRSQQK